MSEKLPLFYVMRHFEREESPSFFSQLTPDGKRRANAFSMPDSCEVRRVVSSPFLRCIQSVKPFVEENDIPLFISCDLGEYIDCDDHGIGQETPENLQKRVQRFLIRDLPHRTARRTLYVTHQSTAAEILNGRMLSQGECVSV